MKKKDQNKPTQCIEDLISQAPVAISFLRGFELIIESANQHILELWGRQENIIGKPLNLALPGPGNKTYVKLISEAYKNGHIYYGYETKILLNRNGYDNLFYFDFVYKPVTDTLNTVIGVLVVATEVTKQVVARQLLEDAEERLRLAIQATGIGSWDFDMVTNDIIASSELSEILGLDPEEKATSAQLQELIHPDDRNMVEKAFERAIQTGVYFHEARVVWADGSIHWIKTSGKVIYDEQHKPLRMLGTINDITEHKQDEIMKNDFIAMASHELKTPLTSLKAYTQLLAAKAKKAGDEFFINALEKSEKQINKMTRLIYGFLDLSKIEAGKMQLNSQLFDVSALITEVVADNIAIAPGHNLFFTGHPPVHIVADREKIAQVLGNLISNAVKYSAKGSTITVAASVYGQTLRVSVKDQGIGLKLKDQQNIFQRFYRVENESTHRLSGFGIGLYLSAEIIKLHQGKIGVESEEGKGSEFFFLLPLPTHQ